jgi:hypothetical protein
VRPAVRRFPPPERVNGAIEPAPGRPGGLNGAIGTPHRHAGDRDSAPLQPPGQTHPNLNSPALTVDLMQAQNSARLARSGRSGDHGRLDVGDEFDWLSGD